MQYFKGDETELKYVNSAQPILENLSFQKSDFFTGAYEAAPLGDVLYESNRTPLANAILQSIFRTSFKEIFDAFGSAGTFESYITVFQKIFGDTVEVTFTVSAPGKLGIDIVADGIELSDMIARRIESNVYVNEHVIDEDSNNIVFQTVKGFTSQYELEQMLREMVPAGIFTAITLDLGA